MFATRFLRSNKIILNLSCYDIQEVFQEKSHKIKPINKVVKIIEKKNKDKKQLEKNLKYLSQK